MDRRRQRPACWTRAALACTAWSVPALAAADTALEEIIVTGSRIARPDFTSASPIVSVDQARFEQTSATSVGAVLETLPQFVPTFGSTSNNPANGGQANLALRGLPTTATLVLLDGRRLMPANGTGVVDVNIVPPALVESVEIITGGASAVYGSDALAGVVNFRLRDDFEGVEIDAMGGVTDEGDGDDYSFGLAAGTDFAGGRGSVMGYAGYAHRELVAYAERGFSRYAIRYLPPELGQGTVGPGQQFIPTGSFTVEEGRVRFAANNLLSRAAFDGLMQSYGYAPGSVPFQRDVAFNTDGTLFTLGLLQQPVPGAVANFRGPRDALTFNDISYTYNFAPVNALQLPLDRLSLFGHAEFEASESATVYAEALYADYSATQQLAATPVMDALIPITNPYIPPDLAILLRSRRNPAAPFTFLKRMSDLGPRQAENRYDVLQTTLGVQGRFGERWSYEAYAQYGRNEQEQDLNRNVLRSRFEELSFAADGGLAACGGFNPFGLRSISARCAKYIAANGTNRSEVEQLVAEASVGGELLSLPAGGLTAVLGSMYKQDDYRYTADPIARTFLPDGRSEIIGFNASDDVEGDDHNLDVYTEVLVPVLAGAPGAESLEIVLGYRYSDYDSAGGADSYKAELLYRPVQPLLLRGSYQHAVRAPSVFELYQPQLGPEVFLDVSGDPCNFDGPGRLGADAAEVARLCLAQGLPAILLPTYSFADFTVPGVAGGNPDLGPEQADTYTVGVVYSPPAAGRWLQGLQLSLDWYDIEITDAIALVSSDDFVARCYDRRFNPKFSPDNVYCSYFARDPASGEIVDARELLRNIAGYRTSGLDLQADWRAAAGPGEVGLNLLVGYVSAFEELAQRGVPVIDTVGTSGNTIGSSLPEWKLNVRASYLWSDVELGAGWRYVDSMRDAQFPDFRIPSRDYLDLWVGYRFPPLAYGDLTLRAGAENVLDTEPPIFPSYVQANTDPSLYDTLGRRYYLRLNYRL